jgi:DNA-binding CsgD family transcriptional regulator
MAEAEEEILFDEAWLAISGGENVPVSERCTIGRHPDNALVLNSNRVSRWHAAIVRLSLDEFRLMDLDTKNGTVLNGHRITEPVRLRDGDRVRIGDRELRFLQPADKAGRHLDGLESTVGDTGRMYLRETENFEPLGHGIAVLGEANQVEAVTEAVREWLWRYFPEFEGDGTSLPPELEAWLNEQMEQSPAAPNISKGRTAFKRHRGERRLVVRIKCDHQNGMTMLLLTEEEPLFTHESLRRELRVAFGVTEREADVVFYLLLGKTNPEIALILDIAGRTTQKHVENIFPKLGVENRQAAIVFIFEFCKRLHAERME